MTSGTHALILAQSAFEAVCKERDEALALLASEKSTRNAIIAKGVEMEKQLEAMREAIKEARIEIQYAEAGFAGLALRVCPNDSAVESVLNRMTEALAKLQSLA
jgi:hypothetical protein